MKKIIFVILIIISAFIQIACSSSHSGMSFDGTGDFEKILTHAKRKVFPALVFVKPIKEEFAEGERKQQEVFGSGVIISEDGYIVTNNHVAEKAIQIYCVLSDKTQYSAEIIGTDPETDLALLKIVPKDTKEVKFPFAEFGNSDTVEEGQFVMALGSPFGFSRSISLGIVSNVNRYLGFDSQYKFNTWIQTDAAINPGNSGGPLVNKDGKIVGINTLGLGMFAEGMAFSIPGNVVSKIVEKIKRDNKVIRSWTGLQIQALKDFQTNTFASSENGVLIQSIDKDSPAEIAGIAAGDIITMIDGSAVNGIYVEDLPAIRWLLADLTPDKKVNITFVRNNKTLTAEMTPTLKEKFEGEDLDLKKWNFTVKEISKFSTPDLYFNKKEGVFIQGVRYPGNASEAGFRKNDIISKIDNQSITKIADVKEIYNKITADETREKKVLIEIIRKGYAKLLVLDYRHDYSE